jgi:hypothetical protein
LEETLKEFMELVGQPTIPASHEPSLEDTLEVFRQTVNQPCQEIIDATVANTEVVARLEGQFDHLEGEPTHPIPSFLTLMHLINHVNIVIILLPSLMIALS